MGFLNDLTMQQIFSRLVAFLVVAAVHGFALAGLARLLGDPRPMYEGRLTLNPVTHLSMLAMAMAIIFQMGWITPMRFDLKAIRFGRWGLALIALGSLLATLLVAPLVGLIKPLIAITLPRSATLTGLAVIDSFQNLSIWFVLLNLLPIPIVTGSLFLIALWPRLEAWLRRYSTVLMALLIAAIVTGLIESLMAPIFRLLKTATGG